MFFLSEEYVVDANEYLGLSERQLGALLDDLRIISADSELINVALKWKTELFAPRDRFERVITDGMHIPAKAPLMPVIVLLSGLDGLKRFYREHGIADKVLKDILFDVSRTLDECYARNGRYVVEDEIFGWLARHFTARLFHLGVLQFEAVRFNEDNYMLKKGDLVLNTHIPSAAKLPHDEVVRSYSLGAELFGKLMPDIEFKGFICESWMLSPQLKDFLDDSSNIIMFLKDYELYGVHSDDNNFYSNIFVKKPDDLHSLPEKTRLQRAIKTYLLAGGKLEAGRGFMPIGKYSQ